MELRKIIRTDIAASAIAHLTLVALIIVISEVHPFHAAAPETVAVDIVTPEQVKQEEARAEEKAKEEAKEKPPEPLPDLKLPKLDATDKSEPASKPADKQQAAAQPSPEPQQQKPPQQQSQPQPSPAPKPREANVQPQQPPQPTPQPPPQAMPQPQAAQPPPPPMSQPEAAPPPAFRAPEPDVTVKYGVMLGLPETPSPLPSSTKDAPKDDVGGAQDTVAAKLSTDVIAELYRHLRSCAKPPAEISRSDKVHIKLRAFMTTDGRLAAAPALVEASASPAKGLAMLESARSALEACQPYTMLPADKYREWRVLDLTFTPKDLGAS